MVKKFTMHSVSNDVKIDKQLVSDEATSWQPFVRPDPWLRASM